MKTASAAINAPEKKLVAPDGGWGWVVVFASALSNIILIPIIQSFGLLFKDRFIALGMSATDCSVIINVNSAFGMGLGLLNGPLLRRFTFRKVAMAGTMLVFIGVTGLTWANSFVDFLIFYSFITSFGTIVAMSSFSLALNTYFKERRSRAAGFAMTATGFGPIIMPQLISILMMYYGVSGTVFILGGLSLHAFMAALLLQPVKWHMKPAPLEDIDDKDEEEESTDHETEMKPTTTRRRYRTLTSNSDVDIEIDTKPMYGMETPLMTDRRFSVASDTLSRGRPRIMRSTSQVDETIPSPIPVQIPAPILSTDYQADWWSASLETINLGSSVQIFRGQTYTPLTEVGSPMTRKNKIEFDERDESNDVKMGDVISITIGNNQLNDMSDVEIPKKKKNLFRRALRNIVVFFDFDLLRDPGYVSLMLGSSLAACGELNFSLLTPFIMADLGFSTREIATIMSTIGGADIVFRFISPYIGDGLKQSAHVMYTFGLFFICIARTTLLFFSTYRSVLVVGVFLGIAKGFRTTYMYLVIPSYVPLERLASASGIQMVSNGLLVIILGPLLGVIRDKSGSYNVCIIAINGMTMITVIMWTSQLLVLRRRKKLETKKQTDAT